MSNYKRNITARSEALKNVYSKCPLVEVTNVNKKGKKSLNQSQEIQNDSLEVKEDVENVYDKVLITEKKVENVENIVQANTHQSRMENHEKLFQELRKELSKLRRAKEKRALLIKQLKEQVRTMKLEVEDLTSLRDSFRDLPPCTST